MLGIFVRAHDHLRQLHCKAALCDPLDSAICLIAKRVTKLGHSVYNTSAA